MEYVYNEKAILSFREHFGKAKMMVNPPQAVGLIKEQKQIIYTLDHLENEIPKLEFSNRESKEGKTINSFMEKLPKYGLKRK